MRNLTEHATVRMQQRGISRETLKALLACGTSTHDGHGATIVFFDKRAFGRLRQRYCDDICRSVQRQPRAYAVVSTSGAVITVGHRGKRINRR